MKCPLCKDSDLKDVMLEEDLQTHSCEKCGGNWISSSSYWRWLEGRDAPLPEKAVPDEAIEVSDTKQAKICPDAECGRIMLKYKIGHGVEFYVEQCGACNGVWFDRNEWEALKSRNLHDKLDMFFTESWQRKLRDDNMKKELESIYSDKFGLEDFRKIQQVKDWLDGHLERQALLAFLDDDEPFKP